MFVVTASSVVLATLIFNTDSQASYPPILSLTLAKHSIFSSTPISTERAYIAVDLPPLYLHATDALFVDGESGWLSLLAANEPKAAPSCAKSHLRDVDMFPLGHRTGTFRSKTPTSRRPKTQACRVWYGPTTTRDVGIAPAGY